MMTDPIHSSAGGRSGGLTTRGDSLSRNSSCELYRLACSMYLTMRTPSPFTKESRAGKRKWLQNKDVEVAPVDKVAA